MKVYKITMELPWRHSEPEKEAEEKAEVRSFFSTLPSCSRQEPDNNEWLVDERDLGAVMVRYANSVYSAVAIKSVEVIMDTLEPEKAVSAMLDRLELSASRLYDANHDGFNATTQYPISGPHLHSLNRLLLLENCCTDEMQSALDAGWRIVAVCPQEARRPDYVLGRCTAGEKFGTAARSFD